MEFIVEGFLKKLCPLSAILNLGQNLSGILAKTLVDFGLSKSHRAEIENSNAKQRLQKE